MIILDTNVVSELMRPKPSEVVVRWVKEQRPTSLYTTTVTEAEILFGAHSLPKGKRRDGMIREAEAIFAHDFGGRVLAFGSDAAMSFARIASERRRRGVSISTADAQIAGIVRAAGAALATRNIDDFESCGFDVINPWEE